MMTKFRYIIILFFISNITFAQYEMTPKGFKLSGIEFKTYKRELTKDNIKVTVNPNNLITK